MHSAARSLKRRCAQLEETLRARSLYLSPDLTLDLLARKTGTPARHISRAVNATRGCNVSQWINSFRIAHAQQLLRQTASPVTEVMLASGFNTKSNFNREFSRIVGMSPVEYRRAAADNAAPDSETRLSAP
ncbi:AraC family transcriptional regulator [Cronobacter sakazakii]|uniref:helix-turn-helix domain-containing protein n=1 Tax=Cronobacter sakazakii TaxID=28141 RepID=UPI002893FEBD|nr:AraC family transcriptional regulator [Cronobacter sakazakii]MDT3640673.1 AraC family transcriptional regulator [Cronobacter sakazakii]